jgi:MauM/NapG family ferredoxin protein
VKASTARRVGRLRVAVLTLFLAGFAGLLLIAGEPGLPAWLARGVFFFLDPLILLHHLARTHTLLVLGLLALIPLALTLVFGRFFCGWVCPFGAIHEFVTWTAGPRRGAAPRPNVGRLRIKLQVLALLLVAALAGMSLLGWFDPFALLTRSAASAIVPAAASILPGGGDPPRVAVQPVLIGAVLFLLIALNAWKRRFFCTTLCPLGALYGLVARLGLMHFAVSPACDGCRTCARRCPYDGGPGRDFLKSECVACLHCVQDCPRDGISITFSWPPRSVHAGVDLGRRRLLGAAAAGFALALLPRGGMRERSRLRRGFLRPPGAVREEDFLTRCLRCGQCAQACPTSFIQPAALEAGFDGIWTPVLNARAGFCAFECTRCTQVCPSGAIVPLTLTEKKAFKIGTAAIDKNRCFTHADGFNCTACVDRCPVPGNALKLRELETDDFHGRRVRIRQVYVVPDLCTGCGICEHVCPRGGAPGIVVTSEDEVREAAPPESGSRR